MNRLGVIFIFLFVFMFAMSADGLAKKKKKADPIPAPEDPVVEEPIVTEPTPTTDTLTIETKRKGKKFQVTDVSIVEKRATGVVVIKTSEKITLLYKTDKPTLTGYEMDFDIDGAINYPSMSNTSSIVVGDTVAVDYEEDIEAGELTNMKGQKSSVQKVTRRRPVDVRLVKSAPKNTKVLGV